MLLPNGKCSSHVAPAAPYSSPVAPICCMLPEQCTWLPYGAITVHAAPMWQHLSSYQYDSSNAASYGVTVYPASSTSPTLQAILQPHYHKRTRSIVLQPRSMTRSHFRNALTITTVDSYNLLVAGNLSRTLRSRSLVQPRGSPLLRRFGVRGLLRPLSASSTDPSQRACLTSYEPK
jgi:hypothetical protein